MTCENFEIGRRQPSSERYTPDALLVARIEEMIDTVAPKQGMSFDALCPVKRCRQILVTDEYTRIYPYAYPELEYRVARGLTVPIVIAAPESVSDSLRITPMVSRTPGIVISARSDGLGEHEIRIKQTVINCAPDKGFTDNPGFLMEYRINAADKGGGSAVCTQAGRFASVDEYGLIQGSLKKKPTYSALVILVDVIGRKDHAGFTSGRVEFTGFAFAENPRAYRKSPLVYLHEYLKHNSLPEPIIRRAEELLWRNPPDVEQRGRFNTLVEALMGADPDTAVNTAEEILDVPLEVIAGDLRLQEEDIYPTDPVPEMIPRARKMFEQALQAVSAGQNVRITG